MNGVRCTTLQKNQADRQSGDSGQGDNGDKMKQVQKDLMTVIKCVLHHDVLLDRINSMPSEEKSELMDYARKQNLLHFFQYFDSFFEGSQAETFRNSIFSCVYMDAVLTEEIHGLLNRFEADGIGCVTDQGIVPVNGIEDYG